MTQYAALIYSADVDWTQPQYADVTKEYAAFAEAAGAVIRGGAALYPTSTATSVRVEGKGGKTLTTDGPYAETKEALTGFYLLECADLDEAVKVASTSPGAWDGVVEVRPGIECPG
jgi:hypothetical protein